MADEFLNNFKIPDYILVPESKVEKCDESGLVVPVCPVLVFVNSKSGGQLGGDLLQTYRTLLSEKQVFDLGENAPDKVLRTIYANLESLKKRGDEFAIKIMEKLRLIVAGGDGTAGWLLGVICDLKLSHPPAIATVPLGTGNNLPFAFGWGKKNPGTDQRSVEAFLDQVMKAKEMKIDNWHILMRMRAPKEGSCDPIAPLELPHSLHAFHRVSDTDELNMEGCHTFRGGFWNYFSMGMDAQVSYAFHSERKMNPEKFKNQLVNQKTYAKLGCTQGWFFASLIHPSSRNIAQLTKVKIMQKPGQWQDLYIPPSIRSIVCLNLPSFSGGFNPWGTPNQRKQRDRDLTPPYVDDGLIEVVGFRDAWHGLVLLAPKGHGTRLAQAHRIRFEFCKGGADHTFMRIDGEPWKQPLPVDDDTVLVEITHHGQVNMLATPLCKSQSVYDPSSPHHDNEEDESDEEEDSIAEEYRKFGAAEWKSDASQKQPESDIWMKSYANALCINTWQVKRYIDAYSASSAVGFSHDDLSQIASVYAEAENHWLHSTKKLLLDKDNASDALMPALKWQIDAYFNFLTTVAELARSKWTEFDLNMMGTGIGIMLISLIFQVFAILRATKQHGVNSSSSSGNSLIITSSTLALFLLGIRSCSLLSNSYILEEGKVANFLLSTSGIVTLRQSVIKEKLLTESIGFLLLSTLCRFAIEVGLSKQAATSAFMKDYSSWIANIASDLPVWDYTAKFIPMLVLILLAFWLYKATNRRVFDWPWKYVILGTILSYMLIVVHWITGSDEFGVTLMPESIGRNYIPRIVYAIALGQLLLLACGQLFKLNCLDCKTNLVAKTTAMLSAWSSTVILLSGKQGPIIAVASVVGGYCIMRLDNIDEASKDRPGRSFSIMQWSLFATCVFFCSGHWCAFDGLRYGAAFIGFEEFMLVRQAILLAIDTYGFSIILPVFGLPFLVATKYQDNLGKHFLFTQLSQMYTTYGLITAVVTTFTILCVTIQRRHLMVWGLFAPKFVFGVVELILTDVLICLASIYYFDQGINDGPELKSSDY